MLFGRSGAWQNDADGERGGNEQSGRHGWPNFAPGSSARRHSAPRMSPGCEVRTPVCAVGPKPVIIPPAFRLCEGQRNRCVHITRGPSALPTMHQERP
jgi:hypothetical protein